MVFSAEHCENAFSWISVSEESGANVIMASDAQSQKQCLPRISTDAGMQIESREKHGEKAKFSIRCK
jgi:hypothetical protein